MSVILIWFLLPLLLRSCAVFLCLVNIWDYEPSFYFPRTVSGLKDNQCTEVCKISGNTCHFSIWGNIREESPGICSQMQWINVVQPYYHVRMGWTEVTIKKSELKFHNVPLLLFRYWDLQGKSPGKTCLYVQWISPPRVC